MTIIYSIQNVASQLATVRNYR